MRVLAFGTYDAKRHPRAGILIEGLRARGVEVVELNEPLGFPTAQRIAMLQNPLRAVRFIARLARCWFNLARRARRLRRQQFDLVLVGYLGHFDVLLARALFRRSRIALDQLVFAADTALDRRISGSIKLAALRLLDRLAVACADLILIDTDEHRTLIPAGQEHKAIVLPVGASRSWFEAARAVPPTAESHDDPAQPLRVVFFGLYTPLQGTTVIGEALAKLADRRDIVATMIGEGQDRRETEQLAAGNPHVTWIDWVSATELPRLVAEHDVCLGIFGVTPKALRVVPNKVYQGAAAGCVIVTSDTSPQRRALGEAALYVPPGDAAALAQALTELAADRTRVRHLRAAALERARATFQPSAIAQELLTRLSTSNRERS
ncbi:MAG: glycosyltransferase [Acidothermus sp.]|nr:glycosyltransferase [Acidothermus sp.]